MGWSINSHSSISTWGRKNKNPTNGNIFKLNDQRLRYFVENIVDGQMIETIDLQ